MSLDEETLETCAETGQIEYSSWPNIISPLIDRLNEIAQNEFPIPTPYPIINSFLPSQRSAQPPLDQDYPSPLIHATPHTPRTLPPVPPFPASSAPTHISASQTQSQTSKDDDQPRLPPELQQILNRALQTLRTTFSDKPPHTVQRLSELVLYPKKHYRTLPAYLRALDRVVSVSSSLDIFPLDAPTPVTNGLHDDTGALLLPNTTGYVRADDLGSDESLGGALLTPIPWLKHNPHSPSTGSADSSSLSKVSSWQDATSEPDNEFLSEGLPSGPDLVTQEAIEDATAIEEVAAEHRSNGTIPDRRDHAVTQGELLRLEQEAGVVPVPVEDISLPDGMLPESQGGPKVGDDNDKREPFPHARGPDVVGTVDMGLVGGQERNVRISSPDRERMGVNVSNAQEVLSGGQHNNTSPKSGGSDDYVHVTNESTEKKDEDGDIVLVDVDGMEEHAVHKHTAEVSGGDVGSDATAH